MWGYKFLFTVIMGNKCVLKQDYHGVRFRLRAVVEMCRVWELLQKKTKQVNAVFSEGM